MSAFQIEPHELCRMFISDCLIMPREPMKVPLTALDQLLLMYCEHIGSVKPNTRVLANTLREMFQECKPGGKTHFVCAIRPQLLNIEGKNE